MKNLPLTSDRFRKNCLCLELLHRIIILSSAGLGVKVLISLRQVDPEWISLRAAGRYVSQLLRPFCHYIIYLTSTANYFARVKAKRRIERNLASGRPIAHFFLSAVEKKFSIVQNLSLVITVKHPPRKLEITRHITRTNDIRFSSGCFLITARRNNSIEFGERAFIKAPWLFGTAAIFRRSGNWRKSRKMKFRCYIRRWVWGTENFAEILYSFLTLTTTA